MDSRFLKTIKKQLEKNKRWLEKELNSFAKKNKQVKGDFKAEYPDYGTKSDENAQEVAAYQDHLSLEGDLEIQLKEINQALRKIEKGQYGICENCKKPINEERLKFIPQAKFCIECSKE